MCDKTNVKHCVSIDEKAKCAKADKQENLNVNFLMTLINQTNKTTCKM